MPIEAVAAPLAAILDMREEYRRELGCQIVHDSWHARGFTTSWLLRVDGETVGYGAVGGAPREERDIVKELFVRPSARLAAPALFRELVRASGARWVEAQSNDPHLAPMLDACEAEPTREKVLFADATGTALAPPVPGAVLRALGEGDRARVFAHTVEPVGDWGVDVDDEIVATGGLAFHYNPPYADLYMEVSPPHRRRGVGAFLVQELRRVARETGHIPAARCDVPNVASRRTLERAGMRVCGYILRGRLPAQDR